MTGDAILHGDGVAVAIKVRGKTREIHRLNRSAVSIQCDPATGEPRYIVTLADGGSQEYSWADVIHIPGIFNGGPISKSIIQLAREAIGVDITMR